MKSLFSLVREYPSLRIYSIRAGLAFGSFLAMWSCLAFKMGEAPFHASSDVIGILGLCGIAGALTASFVGKYVKKVGIRNFNFIGCGMILLAWASLFFLRKQLCRYHYRCHSYRHRHAMYPTQQPDQYFRHLPVCLQSGKYDFHDHLLHRRLFGYLPCRKQLADLGMEWRGRHRRYFNNNIVVHHPLQQEITRILSFFQANAKI